ncbi:aspartate aminotransferase family protein [Candidatus Sumerlaeota bacterium]|nr:aspartate aminotransferase family protein [Candidatus Sumerlaeota bacterium]
MNLTEIKELSQKYLMNTYGERDVCLVKGEGVYVWDSEGKKYLDFVGGIGVCDLGHCHPAIVEAVTSQVCQLIHCSNLYYIEPQVRLAQMICEHSFAEKCFFANTGAEAGEGALKLARYYAKKKFGEQKYGIITFYNSFHGRTMAMVTATGQERFQRGFEPLLPGFKYAEFNNIDSVRKQIDETTCGVMIEPVQGEGGIVPATQEFMQDLRQLCDENNLLLVFDEVQCGLGRIGTNFAYEYYNVIPDILMLAKALGGGVPIGAVLAGGEVADAFDVSKHATTFGGNPLACSSAIAFLNELFGKDLAARAAEIGSYFKQRLESLREQHSVIKEVRGIGLMLAMDFSKPVAREFYRHCLDGGLLVNVLKDDRIRLLPPLIIEKTHCDKAFEIMNSALEKIGA